MYRNIILLTSLIFFITNYGIPQSLNIEWQGCYGGSDTEYPYDLLQVEGGYLVAGGTKSINGDISFNHGATDSWLFKIDYQGELIWEKTFGGSYGDGTMRIFPTNDNCYYLLGTAYSSDGDITYDPYPESTDFWILKVDSVGNILWDKILGGNTLDQMWTGISTNDGGVIALGWSGSDDGDISIAYGGYDMWMVKLNSDGEKEWDFSIGTDGFDYGYDIIETSDGGFLVGGTSTIGNGGNLICTPYSWAAEAILVKLDSNMNIEWQQCYGGSDHDGVFALLELEDGYMFSGYGSSDDGDLTGSGWHGEGDIWIVKVDFDGNIIWQKCFGGSNGEVAFNLYQQNDQGYIFFGQTRSNDGDISGNHSQSEYDHDIWVVKLNFEGVLEWQQCIGGAGNEATAGLDYGVVKKSDNNFVVAAQTDYGPSFDVACLPHGGEYDKDFWVFEIKDTTTNISTSIKENGIKVYPNPAKKYVVFEVQSSKFGVKSLENKQIRVTNTFGQQVALLPVKSEKVVWDTRIIDSGLYFYSIDHEETFITGKIVISK